jgi:predicted enzyme related to lactoylglutathione lyase
VADADQSAGRCAALGGNVLVPPMDIPTVGRMAVLQDPQGAVISVIAYAMP